jgi:predicted nicotinamide N-methyase
MVTKKLQDRQDLVRQRYSQVLEAAAAAAAAAVVSITDGKHEVCGEAAQTVSCVPL